MSSFLLLLIAILHIVSVAAAPRQGLTFTRQPDAAFPPRANAGLYLLHHNQTYVDSNTYKNVTVGPNSLLLYGGDFDCVPDVWLSPSTDHNAWTFIAGWTSFDDCLGPFIPSASPDHTYSSNSGSMHCIDSNDRTYFMGGFDRNASLLSNTVWTSDDHLYWNNTFIDQQKGGFSGRSDAQCIILNYDNNNNNSGSTQEILVIGGNINPESGWDLLNDVWISNDNGFTWTLSTQQASFAPRQRSMVTSWQDPRDNRNHRLYVIGGMIYQGGDIMNVTLSNDVFVSMDKGITWHQQAAAIWLGRSSAGIITTAEGLIIIIAGAEQRIVGTYTEVVMQNDIYISFNYAASWINCTTEVATVFTPRERPSIVLDEMNHLWFTGGIVTWPTFGQNDVWKSDIDLSDVKGVAAACGITEKDIDPTILDIAAYTQQQRQPQLSRQLSRPHTQQHRRDIHRMRKEKKATSLTPLAE